MKRITHYRLFVGLLTLIALVSSLTTTATAAKRRNVLFLFTDDQRADTVSALGNPLIKTPHLDGLANSGFIFRNAYCFGANSGAVCFPSRNMLLSGRAYFRFKGMAEATKPNFPKSMNDAGYVTYHHGKAGNTAKVIHKQFDVSKYLADNKERTSGYPGKTIVDEAIDFLKEEDKTNDDRPFFLYLAFSTPHDPRVAAKKYLDLYDRDKIPLPVNYLPLHPFDNGDMAIRDERLAKWPRTKKEVRKHLHDYYAVITGLDEQIGRLLNTLKQLDEYDETIIVFSSDHGLAIGSHGLMGKQSLYEHSMKAPLFVSGPGIPKGESDALVYLYDIFPTVCELNDIDVPKGLDGQSLASIIDGKQKSVRETLFTSYKQVMRSVRDDRWKLIRYPHINRSQLFDLENDPHELKDLAGSASGKQHVQRLMSKMSAWQKHVGDTQPLTSENPQDETFTPPKPGSQKKKPRKKKKAK